MFNDNNKFRFEFEKYLGVNFEQDFDFLFYIEAKIDIEKTDCN